MIKTIIFDFGDVFINLDKQGTIKRTKELLDYDIITETKSKENETIFRVNDDYEKGLISTNDFIDFYYNLTKNVSKEQITNLWNSLIRDLPKHRLEFIKQLKSENDFNLILLSNTNELHINWIKKHISFYEEFKACFHKFYLSHEIHLRKPNREIFDFVLNENHLKANECLFIDDTKQNTDAASQLGMQVWNNNPNTEDVTNLFNIKNHLFD